jgi:hypothetical protein
MNWKLIKNKNFYNVGFVEINPQEFVDSKKISNIEWLRHRYKNHFIADPFILRATDDEIILFVEECPFINSHDGIIVELHVDRKTKTLISRYELLKLDTHLSYPAILRKDDKIYVYPENGQSGKLFIYEYDEENHRLINPKLILNESVVDATIIERTDGWYLTATRANSTRKDVYLYRSDNFDGIYEKVSNIPFNRDIKQSRSAGNFFSVAGELYRPAQDCEKRYGAALSIMKVDVFNITIKEHLFAHIEPIGFRYNLGIHTINFYDGICVVDGYGYLHPFLARFYYIPREWVKSLLKLFGLKK